MNSQASTDREVLIAARKLFDLPGEKTTEIVLRCIDDAAEADDNAALVLWLGCISPGDQLIAN